MITLYIYCFWAGDRLVSASCRMIYVFESRGYDVNQEIGAMYAGAPFDAQKFDFCAGDYSPMDTSHRCFGTEKP